MSNHADHIANQIRENLITIVEETGSGDSARIIFAAKELDTVARERGDELEPQLAHFLERRSYQKALEFLREES